MQNWLLRQLSDVFNLHQEIESEDYAITHDKTYQPLQEELTKAQLKAQGEWFGAIAALEEILLSLSDTPPIDKQQFQGLFLCGPTPVLSHSALVSRFQTGIFKQEAFKQLALMPCQLKSSQESLSEAITCPVLELPLLPNDPIANEQFCLVFTANFSLLMLLGEDYRGLPSFEFSFAPEDTQQAWKTLRSRLQLTNPHHLQRLDRLVEQFTPPTPDYRLVTHFSRQLLKHLPDLHPLEVRKPRFVETIGEENSQLGQTSNPSPPSPLEFTDASVHHSSDIELLQALTHEIRTPLTTIRTLTRLLLKRAQLTPDVVQRLEVIDQECTEQIDRMELIFRAAELETKPRKQQEVQLTSISLEQVLQQSIPRWKKQAQRRNVMLDFILPQKLPQIVSDPAMLDQVLTGLMEKFTRSLPTGGKIEVQVTTAGSQLKLQFLSEYVDQENPLKALGQLLMFQPETGSLTLNMNVTKNLFNALGGKLIVRQRPQQGEILTIFLPLIKI